MAPLAPHMLISLHGSDVGIRRGHRRPTARVCATNQRDGQAATPNMDRLF